MVRSETGFSEDKLRYRLDLQAHQIDAVLQRHQVEGKVTSGTVRQRVVEFDVQAPLSAGLERVRGLRDSLMSALGVRDVRFQKQDGSWQLQIERTYEPPVPLGGLLQQISAVPQATAAVGLSDSNQPVMLSFGPEAVSHVLVAGDPGAGKTTLLRTIAISLALANRQSDVQLLLIDGRSDEPGEPYAVEKLWRPLAYLPHLLTDPVSGPEVGCEVLRFLTGEMAYRRKQRVRLPRIVVLIDNVDALLATGSSASADDVLRLLQHGCNVGIHVVAATANPESLDVLLLSNLPVRLLGKLENPAQGRKASGIDDSQAEYLRGAGEFIAVADGQHTYFQVADIGDYDLHWELNRLYSIERPRLLARPVDTRPALKQEEPMPFVAHTVRRAERPNAPATNAPESRESQSTDESSYPYQGSVGGPS